MPHCKQILTIEPSDEIRFKTKLNEPATSYVKLSNPSEEKVFFKIKTTAPKRYCVKPTCGMLVAGGEMVVSITLQQFQHDPATINKHKFMIQTTIAPDGANDPEAIWDEVSPGLVMDSKLRCVFVPAPVPDHTSENEIVKLREENAELKDRLGRPEESVVTSTERRHEFCPPPASDIRVHIFVGIIVVAFVGVVVATYRSMCC